MTPEKYPFFWEQILKVEMQPRCFLISLKIQFSASVGIGLSKQLSQIKTLEDRAD